MSYSNDIPAEEETEQTTESGAESGRDEADIRNSITEEEADAEAVDPEYEDVTEGEEMLSLEDVTVSRDPETGDVLPKRVYVKELDGYGVFVPFDREARERYLTPLENGTDLSTAEKARLLDEHVVTPDLSDHRLCTHGRVTEAFVEEALNEPLEDALFIGILLASHEHDAARRFRGELSETEIELATRQAEMEGNPEPGQSRQERARRRR
jgi:hypothetical protein